MFVDGKHYTNLHCEADGTMFAEVPHPYVHLAKLFAGVVKDDVTFYSSFIVEIDIRVL